jgi:tetratricopeptide (TPR) repeat protein
VVQTAEKYVSRGKIEPAIREYRKLLADNPNDINTLNRIGDLYARIQRIDEAVDFFTQIAEQYSTEGFFVKAIAIYKKIIKLDPTRLEVYEKLAELYHKQGLVNEARTQYQVLADYYQKHDNAASAIAIYQKMADLEPNNPSYHVKLAEIYQRQQLIEKAMSEYRVIAEMMLAHDRSQDAAQVYERALDIDSTNVGFIQDAVTRLRASGNTAAAARFLSIAAERNPQAGRLANLVRMDEPLAEVAPAPSMPPVVEARAEPPRPVPPPKPEAPAAPPTPPVVARAPEPRYVPPPPAPPVAEPLGEEPQIYSGAFPEIEIEGEDDLAATMQAAAAALVPGPAALPFDEPGVETGHEEEIDLDLDEVFVLDMESDDEPASLVKPPPDLATDGGLRLGSAWAAPVPQEPEVEEKLGEGIESFPEIDFELEAEPESVPLTPVAPEVTAPPPEPAAPAADLSQFDSLPSLGGEFVFELEEELPPLEGPTWTVEPESQPYEPETLRIDADLLERTAAELQARPVERDEDLVSEAEVLAKYGLEEKALERLRDALKIRPQNLGAYALMIQIHLEKGLHDRVVELARTMSRIAVETGDSYIWPKSRRHLVDAGYRLDGDRVQAGPHGLMDESAPAPKPPPPPPPKAVAPPPAPPAPKPPAMPPAASAPPAPAAAPPPVARKKPAGTIDQMLQGMLDQPRRRRPAAPPAAPPPAAPAPAPPPVVAAPAPVEPPPPMASAPPPPPPPMQAPPPSAPRPGLFNPLEIGEMIEREEMDWDEPEPSGPSPFQSVQPPDLPSGAPGGLYPGLDDTGGMSWLDEADKRRPGKEGRSERLFDEEEDFFDLAGELEQELSQEDGFQPGDGLLGQQAEQSLEEIVEGFKKGVAEHLSPTDYDTHFNLGIAYREMGLLDEAIGEFQIAAKEPTHLVLCCSMLGLCFLDKGLPELAVRWYRRGLDTPGLSEEDNLGLLYDLGCAYLGQDDKESAYKVFVDLYGMDTNYRDVVARIEELGPR